MLKSLFVFSLCTALIQTQVYASELQDMTNQEVKAPHAFTSIEVQEIQDTQFIFVDGTFGDFYHKNFKPAEQVLSDEWHAENTTIVPQTVVAVPENAQLLYTRVRELRQASHKPKAILIGHSKGGTEVMLMTLQHPELIRDGNFVQVGMVSASLGGTRIVAFIDTLCSKHPNNSVCDALGRLFPSLETFLPNVIQPILTDALAKVSEQDRKMLQSRIFYVRTQIPKNDFKSPLYVPSMWMSIKYPEDGPNDGAIPTKNEMMYQHGFDSHDPVFGRDLGIMIDDHNSLMNHTTDPVKLQYRKSFFKTLVRTVLLTPNTGSLPSNPDPTQNPDSNHKPEME